MQEHFFREQYELLNKAQKEVVNEIYGPIMVVAGPGTGKTQIIALRTANIILESGILPENILITTFTEAGVVAIKNRLVKFIGTDAYKVKVSTIHSFAQDVITSFPEKFVEEKAGNTIDDIESLEVLTDIIDRNVKSGEIEHLFTPFDRYLYLRDIKDRIGKLKGEGIDFSKFEKVIANLRIEYDEKLEALKDNKRIRDLEKRTAKDSETYKKHIGKLTELNFIYKEYINYLKDNSLYDFSDMINFVVDKFRIDEDLKAFYAEKYQFVMLDEFQDTNNPQNEIMDLIMKVGDDKNIMVVGDDDQSIYRFQGANIENMLDFYTTYPETKSIVLENNYRSTQSILDLSSQLIDNNSERLVNRLDNLDKKLIAQTSYKELDKNSYKIFSDEQTEKMYVMEEIKRKSPHSISPKGREEASEETFAIIVRSNREVAEWTDYLQEQGLEVESKLKTNILNNKFVDFVLNFLKLVENPHFSDEKFLNILRSNLVDVENMDIITLARELYKKNYSSSGFNLTLWELIKKIDSPYTIKNKDENGEITEEIIDSERLETILNEKYKDISKILKFRDLILELHGDLGTSGIGVLFQKIIKKLGIVEYIESNGSFSDLEDIFTLFNKIKSINENNKDISFSSLINKFDLHKKYNIGISRQILKKSNSNIEILTAHSSKGLEYDYVFIPGVYGGNWENKKGSDKLKLPLGVAGDGLQYSGLNEKELKAVEKEMAIQEDRRLFFVAMTRAKKELIFTRPAGKDNKPYIDSPFMVEIGLESKLIESEISNEKLVESIGKQLVGNLGDLIEIKNEEINYIKEFLVNYKLSPTDLNTFLEDPKEFLKNVVFKYPFNGNEFTIFGNVYHKVLEDATKKKLLGQNVELGFMTEEFTKLLNKQLLTHEEKNRLTKKGIDGLTGYYEIFNTNKRIPLRAEYNFRSRNVVFEGVPITGKIDKIEMITDYDNRKDSMSLEDVAVIDYKTGKIKSDGIIKGTDRYGNPKPGYENGKYFRQLLFYKLLGENDPEFHSKYNISELALDFVEGKDGEYKYSAVNFEQEEYEDFKVLIKDSWEKINNINFWEGILDNKSY